MTRRDLVPLLALALWISLCLCVGYDRWTVEDWRTPVDYSGDTLQIAAWMRAASEGDMLPLVPKRIDRLNAPYQANWNDVPTAEELLFALWGMLGAGLGMPAAMNAALVLAFLAAGASFYAAGRWLGAAPAACVLGAGAFATSTFIWSHSLPHLNTANVWPVPLVMAGLVRLARGELESRRALFGMALLSLAVAGMSPYHAMLYLQLLTLVTVSLAIRSRRPDATRAAALLGVTVSGLVLAHLDTLLFWLGNDGDSGVLRRGIAETYRLGLRVPDLLLPASHRWSALQEWAQVHYYRPMAEVAGEADCSYLGLLGIAGLALLLISGTVQVLKGTAQRAGPMYWMALWIFGYAVAGGGSLLLSAVAFNPLRSFNRFSAGLLALGLLYGAVWLSRHLSSAPRWAPAAVLMAGLLVVTWDQVPVQPRESVAAIRSRVASEQALMADLEARLPEGAMVFQLPLMGYPEVPSRVALGTYDELFPFVYSSRLRFSHGTTRGRHDADWQAAAARLSPEDMVERLGDIGFAAVMVHRAGFEDAGRQLSARLEALLGPPLAASPEAVVYRLRPTSRLVGPPPRSIAWDGPWHALEYGSGHTWRWASGDAEVAVRWASTQAPPASEQPAVELRLQVARQARDLDLTLDDQPWRKVRVAPGKGTIVRIPWSSVRAPVTRLGFHTTEPALMVGGDSRPLAFCVMDLGCLP